MQPPPLAVNNRQVVIPGVIQIQPATSEPLGRCIRPFLLPAAYIAFGVVRMAVFLSCSKPTRHECPALRNFDTEPQSSYRYEVRSDNRLESVANAHTAADLHVRPASQTALVSR